MKRIIYLLALTTLMACKKEDTTPEKANELTVGSKLYKFDEAIIENYGQKSGEGHNNDFWLVTNTIKPIFDDGVINWFTGKGNLLYLELYSNTPNSYEVGNYSLNDTKKPFTFESGYYITDADFDEFTGEYSDIISGTVKVISVKPNKIELEYELTNNQNQKVKGYYNGPTTVYDYSKNPNARIKNAIVKKSKKRGFKL
jgi:hypothetical protein